MISNLDLEPKGQGHSISKRYQPRKQKHATSKNLSRDFPTDVQLIC